MSSHESSNGEFKGSTVARLDRIEQRLDRMEPKIDALTSRQDRWLGVIGAGAFVLPLLIRIFFP